MKELLEGSFAEGLLGSRAELLASHTAANGLFAESLGEPFAQNEASKGQPVLVFKHSLNAVPEPLKASLALPSFAEQILSALLRPA